MTRTELWKGAFLIAAPAALALASLALASPAGAQSPRVSVSCFSSFSSAGSSALSRPTRILGKFSDKYLKKRYLLPVGHRGLDILSPAEFLPTAC